VFHQIFFTKTHKILNVLFSICLHNKSFYHNLLIDPIHYHQPTYPINKKDSIKMNFNLHKKNHKKICQFLSKTFLPKFKEKQKKIKFMRKFKINFLELMIRNNKNESSTFSSFFAFKKFIDFSFE
jgi:hypothetical protein